MIRAFGRESPALSIADVARKTGMARPVARRILLTLVDLGYAGADGKRFHLRPEVLELGFSFLSSLDIANIGQSYLDEIARSTDETCSISLLDGTQIVYIARRQVRRVYSAEIGIGSRLPAYATAMGRVLIAALPPEDQRRILADSAPQPLTPYTVTNPDDLLDLLAQIADQGYALVDQELAVGLRALAVPVRNRADRVVAAMSISSHAWKGPKEDMIQALPHLSRVAADLSSKLLG